MFPASDKILFLLDLNKFNVEAGTPNRSAIATSKTFGFYSVFLITKFFFHQKSFPFYSVFIMNHGYTVIKETLNEEKTSFLIGDDIVMHALNNAYSTHEQHAYVQM
jgi:hypothetical protein